jgi:hypothetical protein
MRLFPLVRENIEFYKGQVRKWQSWLDSGLSDKLKTQDLLDDAKSAVEACERSKE